MARKILSAEGVMQQRWYQFAGKLGYSGHSFTTLALQGLLEVPELLEKILPHAHDYTSNNTSLGVKGGGGQA
ncbi:MAG: hypothetical protein EXR62_02545 [Chloroflexi bacterium]|nr:hypothetical protein [Chloroflexota bacterium]